MVQLEKEEEGEEESFSDQQIQISILPPPPTSVTFKSPIFLSLKEFLSIVWGWGLLQSKYEKHLAHIYNSLIFRFLKF